MAVTGRHPDAQKDRVHLGESWRITVMPSVHSSISSIHIVSATHPPGHPAPLPSRFDGKERWLGWAGLGSRRNMEDGKGHTPLTS